MKVKDVMHKGVDWVSPNTPVTELAKLMREHDIGCIPIGEDDRLIGMVTDRDIVCNGLASNSFDAGRAMARDVMTEGIHCCREDDDLAKAVHHMEKLKLRRLPVMNKSKRMVGIISLGDVSHSASGDLLSGAGCVRRRHTHQRLPRCFSSNWRTSRSPWACRLERRRHLQHPEVVAAPADDLKPNRETFGGKPAGN